MSLPPNFQFSQGSLQDYVDCPRRFELRYVRQVAWPAAEKEPLAEDERRVQQALAFHRLIQQHGAGIAAERLSALLQDEEVNRWWQSYLENGPVLPSSRYYEAALSAPLGGYRLLARYDLVAVEAGRRAVIVDWKTWRRRPQRSWLAGRLQTQVYLYLLVRAGAEFNNGHPFQPEQVEMLYWFADYAVDPERFVYDAARYRADEARLSALIAEISQRGDGDFPMTADERACRYCVYRSFCARGVEAGTLDELEDVPEAVEEIALDFEQIAEVAY